MIADHRSDTLTPVLRELRTWNESVPALLQSAQSGDARLALLVRQAMRDLRHYVLPIGHHVGDSWVFVILKKLETPNKFRAHWSLQNSSRAQWQKQFQHVIAKALGVASWDGVVELRRVPTCEQKMALQIVRLVPSSREFIRDSDNLHFSRKGSTDAMKHVGLLKDDRMGWLDAKPIYQDVSPDPAGNAMTVFFLWPATAGLFTSVGAPDVSESRVSPSTKSHRQDGNK